MSSLANWPDLAAGPSSTTSSILHSPSSLFNLRADADQGEIHLNVKIRGLARRHVIRMRIVSAGQRHQVPFST